MKILFDHKIFWSQKFGGISRYFINLILNIEKNSQTKCKIIAPFYRNFYIKKSLSRKNIFGTNIKNAIPKTYFLLNNFNNFFFKHFSERFKGDLLHLTYYNNDVKKKKQKIKTNNNLNNKKLKKINGNLVLDKQQAIKIADEIICISNNTKKDLLKYYDVDQKKISVIHLGANHLLNSSDSLVLINKKNDIEKRRPFLLYVGSRNKYKNFNLFLDGIANSDKVKKDFDIILFGGGHLTSKEQERIRNLNLRNISNVDGDDNLLRNFYKKAKLFIFPSIFEGFGLPLLEAMSLGCPVLCARNSTFEELAADTTAYFDPHDIHDFKFQLEKILYSGTQLDENRILGLKRSNKFTWSKCAEQTLQVYKRLV